MTQLEISVLDTCTIFEGPDTLFRYDLPGTGIVEGWATEAVVQQAEELLGTWEAGEVALSGESQAVEILTAALESAGAQMTPEPKVPDPMPKARKPLALNRRTEPKTAPAKKLVWASIAAIAMLTGVVSWRWLSGSPTAQVETPEMVAEGSKSEERTTPPLKPLPPPPVEPSVRTMELGGLRVALPVDFGLEQRGEDVMARGKDPRLRVLLSSSKSGHSIAGTLASIQEDPSLELLQDDGQDGSHQVVYLERAEDGSQTRWTQWEQGDSNFFVGCQTKVKATHEQLAVCDQAVQSLEKSGEIFSGTQGT
ncbi:type VII secretion-associated protein [Corynebacterium gerontici]|uniref:Type VII secretion-associated protein n=1 Tax=Corynebacterium gerontici TaxID=2079234 RepID=A0A3G6J1W5_9CORY|nr:type VII secretion-associated protein [Corynebacterium gerontici]AZA12051.1 hypothetical protein CGERO_08800 [Corynebacterium gerontici]